MILGSLLPYPHWQQLGHLHPYDSEPGANITFQTPSELLQLLQDLNSGDDLLTPSPSRSKQETRHATQGKSFRHTLATRVGFEPTDPCIVSNNTFDTYRGLFAGTLYLHMIRGIILYASKITLCTSTNTSSSNVS